MSENQNTLKDVYCNAINRPGGFEWEYQGYAFRKLDTFGGNHSEVGLYNPEVVRVESYSIEAFDSFEQFAEKVIELVEYDPKDMDDWLNYRREQRNND